MLLTPVRIDSGGSLSPKKFSNLSIHSTSQFINPLTSLIVNPEFYRNCKEIGKGKQGKVYYVEEVITSFHFAIKAYCTTIDEEYGIYVKNEYEILSKLNHPNIIKVYELIVGTRVVNLKLEYFDGETIKALIHDLKFEGFHL